MLNGTISHIKTDRGFGFIQRDDGNGGSVFFHAKGLRGIIFETLAVGTRVSFDVQADSDGRLRATSVILLPPA